VGAGTAGSWQVDPHGVQSVLQDVATAGTAIAKAVQPLAGAAQGGSAAADGLDTVACTVGVPSEGLISAAMQAFLETISTRIAEIDTRVPTAATALHDAANAVLAGDDEIAAQIQGTMLAATLPMGSRMGTP
jgi:hypothetical protein